MRIAPYGDADAVVTLLTEREGVVPALARRARSASPKRSMILEPFHTLTVEIAAGGGELSALRSSVLDVARVTLLADARRMEVAGLATRWTRTLSPPRAPEPEVFAALELLLDRLAAGEPDTPALAVFGLTLLEALGYALELGSCARCNRSRPTGRSAYVASAQGGVVCEACRALVHVDDEPFAGAMLDAVAGDHDALMAAAPVDAARVLAVVRVAIDFRARSVGARRGGA